MQIIDYSHIIWDWNGTLLNDVDIARGVTNRMLRNHGLPEMGIERYRDLFGFPIIEYYQRVGFDINQFDSLSREFTRSFYARSGEFSVFPEVVPVLERFQALGLTQSILSASQEDDLIESVRRLGIDRYFRTIDGLSDRYAAGKVGRGRESIRNLGATAQHTLLIGDTTHDCEVARAIGCDCLLIASGHQSMARLEATGAPVVRSLQAVRQLSADAALQPSAGVSPAQSSIR